MRLIIAFQRFAGLHDRRMKTLPSVKKSLVAISCYPLLPDEIATGFVSYAQICPLSDCEVVRFVTRYGILVGCVASPF